MNAISHKKVVVLVMSKKESKLFYEFLNKVDFEEVKCEHENRLKAYEVWQQLDEVLDPATPISSIWYFYEIQPQLR